MNPYLRKIKACDSDEEINVDVYSLCAAFLPGTPEESREAIAHGLKKVLMAGRRTGGKTFKQDIQEAIFSLQQAIRHIKE